MLMTLQLKSSSFTHEHEIPTRHTCEGEDVSPELLWTEPPKGTQGFALVVDDPDAPKRAWVHWLVYDLPAHARSLPEGATRDSLPIGAVEGRNDWNALGWRGPCPPSGRHRYLFKLYALDTSLEDLGGGASKPDLENAMMGHILATATLVGTYKKRT